VPYVVQFKAEIEPLEINFGFGAAVPFCTVNATAPPLFFISTGVVGSREGVG